MQIRKSSTGQSGLLDNARGFARKIRYGVFQRSVLAKVPMGICVSLTGFRFGRDSGHHLAEVLREYDLNPNLKVEDSTLFRFHQRFQPKSSYHLVAQMGSAIRFRPPLGILPWGSFCVGAGEDGMLMKDWSRSRWCGPTPLEVVQDEFRRLIAVYESIKREGYQPWRRGFIGGTYLRRSDLELRYVVLQGNHRMAVLSHLGYERPILTRYLKGYYQLIDERDVKEWYYVRNGQCSREDALAYFRAYFAPNSLEMLRQLGVIRRMAAGDTLLESYQ